MSTDSEIHLVLFLGFGLCCYLVGTASVRPASRAAAAPDDEPAEEATELLTPYELACMEAARVAHDREPAREMAVHADDDAPLPPVTTTRPRRKPAKRPARPAKMTPQPNPSESEVRRASREAKARTAKGGRGVGIVP